MKKVYQIIALLVIFVCALFFFGSRMGETLFTGKKETVAAGDATFPTISVLTQGEEINCLYGYSSNLDTILNREDMIPLGTDGIFELKIKEYDTDVRRLKYEVLDVASEVEMASGTVNAFEKKDGHKIARIKLGTDLKAGTEYAVKVTLISNTGKRIYYYFRIKEYETPNLGKKIGFIRAFVENAGSDKAADKEKIIPYLETKSDVAEDSFHYVDINNSYKFVSWGGLQPTFVTEPVISVTEFYDEIMTAVVRYCVSVDTGYGEEYYDVKEYYRIRHLGDVMHLLNFERHTESLFEAKNASLSQSQLKLGIADAARMELYPNSDNTAVAFVRNGSLYSYSLLDNTITTVFEGTPNYPERMGGQQEAYDIRVLKVDTAGNITFSVNGYMGRGVYEGRVGMFVYRYYAAEHRLEEMIYVPVNTTYQILKEELGGFAYLNEYDVFYFMVHHGMYAYNLVTEELKTIATEVRDGSYFYSVTERYVAYQEKDDLYTVRILYPETGEVKEVKAQNGEYIRLLGKTEDNLIYGYGRPDDLYVNEDGRVTYAMYKVEIKDTEGWTKKVYEKEGFFVETAETTGNIIRLERLIRSGEAGYEKAESDYILNQDRTEIGKIKLTERVTERMLTEYYISFPNAFVMEELPQEASTVYTVMEKDTTLRIKEMEGEEAYYTYYFGMIDDIFENAGEAIVTADGKVGTVINEKGKIVWERGVKASSAVVSNVTPVKAKEGINTLQASLQMMLSTKGAMVTPTAEEVRGPLQEVMRRYTNSDVVVLTGATLDEVLYFIWRGQPVLAMKESGEAVVITAYNSKDVVYYDPGKGRSVTIEKTEAEELFEEGGNIFISFLY